jgi:phosphopantetheinyl transferase
MPIHNFINLSTDCTIGIWHITETVEELCNQFSPLATHEEFSMFNIEKQQKEWLSSRALLSQICDKEAISPSILQKDEYGKPFLLVKNHETQQFHISISHSFPYAVVALHKHKTIGIDIEPVSEKLHTVANRVFSPNELSWATSVENLAFLWCAKEAMYKWYGKKGVDFRKHLIVEQRENIQNYQGFIINPITNEKYMTILQPLQILNYQIVVCHQ